MALKAHLRGLASSMIKKLAPGSSRRRRFETIDRTELLDLTGDRAFEPELKLIGPYLRSMRDLPGIAFDVGANIGEYAYVMANALGPDRVHAFEPNPEVHKQLRKTLPDIHSHCLALSDRTGEARITIPTIQGRSYSTRGSLEAIAEPGQTDQSCFTVSTQTLDCFCDEHNLTGLSAIKIDVEGHEDHVITGAKAVIDRDRPLLVVELEQRHGAVPLVDRIGDIESLGYRGYFLDLRARTFRGAASFDANERQRYEQIKTVDYVNNFIFVPREREDRVMSLFRSLIPALR